MKQLKFKKETIFQPKLVAITGNVVNLPRAEITICFSLMNNEMSFREVI